MSRDQERNPDPNTNAARFVSASTATGDLPADLEAAWAEWSAGIQGVDERGMTLLRAAFDAGCESNRSTAATEFARLGGLKGGKARAEKLTPERRSDIAKKAANARWAKQADDN